MPDLVGNPGRLLGRCNVVDHYVSTGSPQREGDRAAIVCTGPVLLSQAWAAAERLGDVAVIALPWLRDVDGAWLSGLAADGPVF